MNMQQNQPLYKFVSMRLGGPAKYVAQVASESDIAQAVAFAAQNKLPIITLGDGTNVVFGDKGFDGMVLINKLKGIQIDGHNLVVAAGENWDALVEKSVEAKLSGIEALSLIPGTVGAAPVNNVGAYGQEISHSIKSLRVYDTQQNDFYELNGVDCDFGYRQSRFKSYDHGRFVICSITLQLQNVTNTYLPPTYASLQHYFEQHDISVPSLLDVRGAVIAIRSSKLPDPKHVANAGSFFKNPIVTPQQAAQLLEHYPTMPQFAAMGGVKLAAGWLIEQCGLKGYKKDGIRVYEKQALVLVNEDAQQFSQLQAMFEHIQTAVHEKFGVQLEPEPELL